jgi:hypothetical protein
VHSPYETANERVHQVTQALSDWSEPLVLMRQLFNDDGVITEVTIMCCCYMIRRRGAESGQMKVPHLGTSLGLEP